MIEGELTVFERHRGMAGRGWEKNLLMMTMEK
jgi:hypothetical protein